MKRGGFVVWIFITNLFVPKTDFSQVDTNSESRLSGISNNKHSTELSNYLDEASWNILFPHRYRNGLKDTKGHRQDFYSLQAFVIAAGKFPRFLSEGNEEIKKRELSAFLASIAYETGAGWNGTPGTYYTWGLYFMEEKPSDGDRHSYIDSTKMSYPPFPGAVYHGRGPLQLSWNYNYGEFSEAWFGNKDALLDSPELLSMDAVISFASAIWFWMTPQFPKPSCHDIMVGNWKPNNMDSVNGRLPGFGAIVNVINGGVECGYLPERGKTNYRYGYYLFYCDYFHVGPGNNMDCNTQKPFGQ